MVTTTSVNGLKITIVYRRGSLLANQQAVEIRQPPHPFISFVGKVVACIELNSAQMTAMIHNQAEPT